jgi:uncharacterized membrane protein
MESRLSISNVLSGTFSTIGSNPLATLGVAFLLGVLPTQIFSYALIGGAVMSAAQIFTTPGGIALYCALIGVSVLCSMLVQATLVRVTVAYARDEQVSIAACLGASLSKILPLLGLTILMTIALAVATLLLIVPGIILYIMWCVATPVLVAENAGIFEALGRSGELTKGNRWRIFGLFLLLVIMLWIFAAIIGVVFVTTGLVTGAAAALASGALPITYMIVNAVSNTLMTAVFGTLVARLYVDLRMANEGPMTDALADVFA